MPAKQKLLIGIERNASGIERILAQEGVPFSAVSPGTKPFPNKFSALVLTTPPNANQLRNLAAYLRAGGALLTTIETAAKLDDSVSAAPVHISHINPSGKLFASTGKLWLDAPGFLSASAGHGILVPARGMPVAAVISKKFGAGHCIALPFNPDKAVLDTRAIERGFHAAASRRCAAERVSLVSKSNIRQLVVNCLRELHFARGLPYAHLWYYPKGKSGAFAFRIDLDEWGPGDCEKTLALLKKNKIRATWALNAGHPLFNPAFVKKLKKAKQEIQSHGFEHDVFPTAAENSRNIMLAKKAIAEAGAHADAFIAPFGKWNSALCTALASSRAKYSSEFSLDYDNFPFFAQCGPHAKKQVLQIPIHPMSIDRLRTRDFNTAQMKSYFMEHFKRLLSQGLPAIFYGHPTKRIGRYPEVFDAVFRRARREKSLWFCTLGEFSGWWNERAAAKPSISISGNSLVASATAGKRAALRILASHKKGKIIPMGKSPQTQLKLKIPVKASQEFSTAPVKDTCDRPTPIALHRRALHKIVMKAKVLAGRARPLQTYL